MTLSSKRQALLVGSLPFEDEEACMRRALELLGPHLIALPDGEIGEKSRRSPRGDRVAWVVYAIERLTADPSRWRVIKDAVRGSDGMATDYTTFQKLLPLRTLAQIRTSKSGQVRQEPIAGDHPIRRVRGTLHGVRTRTECSSARRDDVVGGKGLYGGGKPSVEPPLAPWNAWPSCMPAVVPKPPDSRRPSSHASNVQ